MREGGSEEREGGKEEREGGREGGRLGRKGVFVACGQGESLGTRLDTCVYSGIVGYTCNYLELSHPKRVN